jgi:hypothetical protein
MKRIVQLAVLIVLCVTPLRIDAAPPGGGHCNPPFGYTWICNAECGTPGTCDGAGQKGDICMLTEDLSGCFWDPQDPCCATGGGF